MHFCAGGICQRQKLQEEWKFNLNCACRKIHLPLSHQFLKNQVKPGSSEKFLDFAHMKYLHASAKFHNLFYLSYLYKDFL